MSSFLVVVALFCAFARSATSAPFPGSAQCPHACQCTGEQLLDLHCPATDFLASLSAAQANAIAKLNISNANLTKLDVGGIKKLHALKSLDVSRNGLRDFGLGSAHLPKLTHLHLGSNRIKSINAADLPKHLRYVDLSGNYLQVLPKGLARLKFLAEVNFASNPLVCSCDNRRECDSLIASGVTFVKPVTCYSGDRLLSIDDVNCTLIAVENELDGMQGDQPVEGSGDGSESIEEGKDVFIDDGDHTKLQHLDEEELIPSMSAEEDDENVVEEGSGDESNVKEDQGFEGSGGFGVLTDEERKACYFEPCAAIKIDEKFYENSTEKNPELGKEIIEGIKETFGFGGSDEESNNKVAGETDESNKTDEDVHEDVLDRSEVIKVETGPTRAGGEKTGIEKAAMDSSGVGGGGGDGGSSDRFELSNNMIIVLALVVIMLCIVIYSICVKRKGRAAPRQPPLEQEMKPLKKKGSNNGNAAAAAAAPEKEPLMNGRNGNMNGKQVDEPVVRKRDEELETSSPQQNDTDDDFLLRSGGHDEGDLPETHRVTIQAKELSTPKTPRLVIRSKAHNGEIITTPSLNRYP